MPLIDSSAALNDVVELAGRGPVVALDTEFVWERTYYPNLGLVQLALDDGQVFLLDPTKTDLSPLGAILEDDAITKILHDAGQDLMILSRATGKHPRNVFDTQLAAGFVGLSASLSLQALLAALLDVNLSKGATRSDWLRRPLSDEQLEYARDDVRFLPQAFRELNRRLDEAGRLAWAREELRAYDDPNRYLEEDPRIQYRRSKGRAKRGFGGREYTVLRELAAWREREARAQNRPRQHVLSDEVLIDIAKRKPTTPQQLERVRTLPDNLRQRYERMLLRAVDQGLAVPREDWPASPRHAPEEPGVTPRLDLVQAILRGRGEREGVDPGLVTTRAAIEGLVSTIPPDTRAHDIFQGWRREFIGADLEKLLAGEAAVGLDEDGLPYMIRHQE